MLYVTLYGAKGACRAGNHIAGTLGAIGPCRAAASCWALLWLGRSRTVDTEVTRSREMMRTDTMGRGIWDVESDRYEKQRQRQSIGGCLIIDKGDRIKQ